MRNSQRAVKPIRERAGFTLLQNHLSSKKEENIMKRYIKPEIEINSVEMEDVVMAITSTNVGITVSDGDFDGEFVDSKQRSIWDWDVNYWNGKTNGN